jgi:hypothetical protein
MKRTPFDEIRYILLTRYGADPLYCSDACVTWAAARTSDPQQAVKDLNAERHRQGRPLAYVGHLCK